MHRNTLWLIAGMFGLFVVATWASQSGIGAPAPAKKPISIREESGRGPLSGAGHHRTRYFFVGGGMHTGK